MSNIIDNNIKSNPLDMTYDRWKLLYKNNDKIIDYLRSLNIDKVIILGNMKDQLYNYIKMYGNKFDVVDNINNINNFLNCLIIDTDNNSIQFKNNSINILSLNELCNFSEYFYFINKICNNHDIHIHTFDFPNIDSLSNLTEDEIKRIKFDHHYRYYYERYKSDDKIYELLKNVFQDLFSDEFIISRNYMPNMILRNGICFLENSNNPFCSSNNGIRRTTNQNFDYAFNMNVFGPCIIFGALVDDENTIPSLLQENINLNNYDYKVNNYGARAVNLAENIRTLNGMKINKEDQFIFIVSQDEKQILSKMGYSNTISLLPVFNDKNLKNYFIDEPIHCNHIANKKIALFIMNNIKKQLITRSKENKNISKPIIVPKSQNVFKDNIYLKEYLKYLEQFKGFDGKAGCILMNCNPFTYGHYKLVEYASSKVDKLYVFVVQEDKSMFKFEDRLKMVEYGCKDFNNVVVIPSGKIFASAMLFPEYFNKEDNKEVSIDVSLDRELFTQYIAPSLNISVRFLGEEKVDKITQAFNKDLKENLPQYGIEIEEIPRFKDSSNNEISAKKVRSAMEDNDYETLEELVPKTTLEIIKKYMDNSKKKIKRRN